MLKTKYTTFREDIPHLRGILHLLTFWLFFPEPIIFLGYLVSFAYHRLPFYEAELKFLDHILILARIVFFDGYNDVGVFLLLGGIWVYHNNLNYPQLKAYTLLSVWIQGFCYSLTGKHFLVLSQLPYVISGALFYRPQLRPWHGEWWNYHEDFHLVLFLTDIVLKKSLLI